MKTQFPPVLSNSSDRKFIGILLLITALFSLVICAVPEVLLTESGIKHERISNSSEKRGEVIQIQHSEFDEAKKEKIRQTYREIYKRIAKTEFSKMEILSYA